MMRKLAGTVLVATLMLLMPVGPSATAHTGLGGTVYYLDEFAKIQAETYNSVDTGCDPAPDGGHIMVGGYHVPDPLGVQSAILPYKDCNAMWWDVKSNHPIEFTHVRLRAITDSLSADTPLEFTFRVLLDTDRPDVNVVAQGPITITENDGYQTFELPTRVTVPSRYQFQTLKIDYLPTGSTPGDIDVWVDWIGTDKGCKNLAPYLLTLLTDGMVNDLIGWAGLDPVTGDPFTYDFTIVGAQDPDGDAFTLDVVWSDERPDDTITSSEYYGGLQTVTRAFDLDDPTAFITDTVDFLVRIIDEPIRTECAEEVLAALYETLPKDFLVIPDLVADIISPLPGLSCHDGYLATTWHDSGLDQIFGDCAISTNVKSAGLPPGSIVAELRIDGQTLDQQVGSGLTFDFDSSMVPEGLHSLEVCYSVIGDKYDRDFCTPSYTFENNQCINRLPAVAGVTGDGMVEGFHSWLGRPYTFEAAIHDPDGDPVTVEWIWGDDHTSSFGTQVEKSFYTAGGHPFQVRLIEDVSARCPGAPTEEVIVHGNMVHAVADWIPELRAPREGWSCIGERLVPTLPGASDDIIASRCKISGEVTTNAPGMTSIVKGSFLMDGDVLWKGSSSLISTIYDSLHHSTEEHTLSACFQADGDKYDRVFCSEGFTYLNIGR
ncbi:MAG: hypothetical protein KY455_01500 [Euryarchaeota archaeon]|nr:hypothetical protein [Euryarchaeota archaeon]